MNIDELKAAWNAQADKYNQWDELGLDEIIYFAQKQAIKTAIANGPVNIGSIIRRIRRCEGEVPAELVLEHAILQAIRAERDACADICDNFANESDLDDFALDTVNAAAAAIRMRSNKER